MRMDPIWRYVPEPRPEGVSVDLRYIDPELREAYLLRPAAVATGPFRLPPDPRRRKKDTVTPAVRRALFAHYREDWATVPELALKARVAVTNLYRVLPALVREGVVERKIDRRRAHYRAVPKRSTAC